MPLSFLFLYFSFIFIYKVKLSSLGDILVYNTLSISLLGFSLIFWVGDLSFNNQMLCNIGERRVPQTWEWRQLKSSPTPCILIIMALKSKLCVSFGNADWHLSAAPGLKQRCHLGQVHILEHYLYFLRAKNSIHNISSSILLFQYQ